MAKPILILAEQLKGQFFDITFEMLGAGRRLGQELQAPVRVVVLGSEAKGIAAQLGGAEKVVAVDGPPLHERAARSVAGLMRQLMEQQDAGLVLLGGTNVSMGIGSMLAARTGLPFVGFGRRLQVVKGDVVVTSQLFGGKILADARLPQARGIISVYPGAFAAEPASGLAAPEVETASAAPEAPSIALRRYIEPESGDVDITKQSVLVAVGRGIQSKDNVALAEELAAALGGAVCASRPVIDQGWLPLSRQVGKSGMTVKPRLYLALGISGAPEHWEGMQASQVIVAINTDPKAPIFDGAQYGVCGDVLEYLPPLIDKVKARAH